ncbi:MAG: transposase, partial [Proteobacteria bacterium]|nr:transposase [Pseudomonadota bacterium]
LWMPVFAAGVINGIGHFWGYRNYRTDDTSRNITRFAFFVFGEELHNNHHAFPASCKFSHRKGEYDLGWFTIKALNKIGLCSIKKTVPDLYTDEKNNEINSETVKAILTHKFNVLQIYIKDVIKPNIINEYQNTSKKFTKKINKYTTSLSFDPKFISCDFKEKISKHVGDNSTIQTLLTYKQELQAIWEDNSLNVEEMTAALKKWCQRAEQSGNQMLQEFAATLKQYKLQPQLL